MIRRFTAQASTLQDNQRKFIILLVNDHEVYGLDYGRGDDKDEPQNH